MFDACFATKVLTLFSFVKHTKGTMNKSNDYQRIDSYLESLHTAERKRRSRNTLSVVAAILLISLTAWAVSDESGVSSSTLHSTKNASPAVMPVVQASPTQIVRAKRLQLKEERARREERRKERQAERPAPLPPSNDEDKEVLGKTAAVYLPTMPELAERAREILGNTQVNFAAFDNVTFAADSTIIPNSGLHPDNGLYVLTGE